MDGQRLSSVGTIAYKYFAPPVFLVPFLAWALAEYVYGNSQSWFPAAVLALVAGLCFVFYFPLKRVSAVPEGLLISNFISTIMVPYGNISKVRESRWMSMRSIKIRLKQPCKFGSVIRFMPRGQFQVPMWRTHPVAKFLREKIRQGCDDPAKLS